LTLVTNEATHGRKHDPEGRYLLAMALDLACREPLVMKMLALDLDMVSNDAELMAAVLAATIGDTKTRGIVQSAITEVFRRDTAASRSTMIDVGVATERNCEPGGEITTLLFSRGIHAIMAHRVAHSFWRGGRRELALATKAIFARAFSTDIHPAAEFEAGVWLDHGLGFVVGETAKIEEGVSIWHGVTLGSTLKDEGPTRHPRLRRGSTIGADAVILGDIDIGEDAVVAAGSVVVTSVPPGTTVAGVPAKEKRRTGASFAGFGAT
jgi:serine O-acetyltransferase